MGICRRMVALSVLVAMWAPPAVAGDGNRVERVSSAPFLLVAAALEQAVRDQGMTLVCRANAQQGAAARGVRIPGNQVFFVFRNDFAVRLIDADPRAAYEAPIRIYLSETGDGRAAVSYVRPSALFQPYGHPEVTRVGAELDPLLERIVAQALAAR